MCCYWFKHGTRRTWKTEYKLYNNWKEVSVKRIKSGFNFFFVSPLSLMSREAGGAMLNGQLTIKRDESHFVDGP